MVCEKDTREKEGNPTMLFLPFMPKMVARNFFTKNSRLYLNVSPDFVQCHKNGNYIGCLKIIENFLHKDIQRTLSV